MSTKQTQKTKRCCSAVLIGMLLAALSAGCSNPAGGNGGGSGTPPEAPFVEGGASLILSPDKLNIKVTVTTSDGAPVIVEGCNETELTSGTETTLHAKDILVILKGKITELNCRINQLTALNVQGLTALQGLNCWSNRLTALNVQGLTALQTLYCAENQLTALNVQGLTALRWLNCGGNQLAALNVQGCTALKDLRCFGNRLTADVFKTLFDNLPVREEGDDAKCYLYIEEIGVPEGNHTNFTVPPDLAAAFTDAKNNKKWKMYKCRGIFNCVEI